MGRWSREMMSALEMAWMRVWTQTLTLKETWLFSTKQQFFQKLTHPSAATVQGHVGPPRTKHPRGTATTKTSWRPSLLCTDRLRYHSPGPKSTALVRITLSPKKMPLEENDQMFNLPVSSFSCRFRACCSLYNLWTTQASACSCWAPWSLPGAKTWDDRSLRQPNGSDFAGWSQSVSCDW